MRFVEYDFKGNLVEATRQLAIAYETLVDWSSDDPDDLGRKALQWGYEIVDYDPFIYPSLYDRRLFGELTDESADGGGKRVVGAHRAEAHVLHWPGSALADIDVPDDFAKLVRPTD